MITRVLLIDDQVMLRQGLRKLLETQTDLDVIGESDTTSQGFGLVAPVKPDVVVLNLGTPAVAALATLQRLSDAYAEARIVILSGDESDATVVAAVRAGAVGVVSTAAPIDDLFKSVRAAAAGHVTFSAAMSLRLVEELRAPVQQPDQLTGRELEVLQCVTQGLSNKQIAWRLRISDKTVKSHVSTILSKFGLESRTQAALHATRAGLVSADETRCSASQRLRDKATVSLGDHRRRPTMRVVTQERLRRV